MLDSVLHHAVMFVINESIHCVDLVCLTECIFTVLVTALFYMLLNNYTTLQHMNTAGVTELLRKPPVTIHAARLCRRGSLPRESLRCGGWVWISIQDQTRGLDGWYRLGG
jgi:hypothetical protein